MILGLTALGEGRMPLRIRLETALTHVLGAMAGGALMALGVWLAATPLRTLAPTEVSIGVVVLVAVVAVGIDLRVIPGAGRGKQVPSPWLKRYGPQRAYALYGLKFGAAFSTLRPFAVVYPVVAAVGLLVSLPMALVCGAVFGIGRTAIVGPASFKSVWTSQALYHGRFTRQVWTATSVVLSLGLSALALAGGVG
jgi:hypothetical protein